MQARLVPSLALIALLPAAAVAQERFAADTAELRGAYRGIVSEMRTARSFEGIIGRLTPDFEHRALNDDGTVRVTPRERFVARVRAMRAAIDSVVAFEIEVTDVQVRGDSAWVSYREYLDGIFVGGAPGASARARSASTSWWRDPWVRAAEGWRVARFVEVAAPAGSAPSGQRR